MKGLTVLQPWPFQISTGLKIYETRVWRSNYRGLIAIHAGSRFGKSEQEAAVLLRRAGVYLPASFTTGAVVALAEMVDCVPMMDTPEMLRGAIGLAADAEIPVQLGLGYFGGVGATGRALGMFGFKLRNVRTLREPFAIRGAQRLWSVPPAAERDIRRLVA